mmetsp:Transcript_4349/g.7319  ORF Transcript_4349/g.7319 Transcript_4349/m.7319 type:complete len:595 (+) Transcript_4349:140-1924(+)
MSPKRNNGKVQQVVSPIKFNAGGNKMNSPSSNNNNNNNNNNNKKKKNVAAVQSSTLSRQTDKVVISSDSSMTSSKQESIKCNYDYQWIKSGLQKKQSPLVLKHWIATVLTLDGRDKFTKILQYSSRLLGWYFAGLAASSARSSSSRADGIIAISQQQQIIYQALSTRFTSLYKSLVTSRKAFRMGRWVIEWDKIRSMGWGEYLAYWLCHPLTEGVGTGTLDDEEGMTIDGRGGGDNDDQGQLLVRLDTHPIPEEEEENEEEDDDISWNGEEPRSSSSNSTMVDEKKDDTAAATTAHPQHSEKVISRPERPILPSRISSNIGWGPSNTTAVENVTSSSSSKAHHHPSPPPPRTVSEMGRQMYRPYPSQSSTSFGSYQQLKGTTSSTHAKQTSPPPPTPAWKLIGGTLKLLGLMGFWAFDNLSFLTSSGFLDPIPSSSSSSSSSGGGDSKSTNAATIRTKRKQRASEYAARCYFMGGLAGLYVNLRSFWIHRNGALMEARRKYESSSAAATTSSDGKDSDDDGSSTRQALKKIEQKHFELFLALLKSICDVMVFSNNPGIDLHLKLRGKKNHEGFHCLCGLISAGTVLYNNFPNAE